MGLEGGIWGSTFRETAWGSLWVIVEKRGVLVEGEVWTVIFGEVKLRDVLEVRNLRFSGEICVIFKSVQDDR